MVPVADFHCDLLSFLSLGPSYHCNDPRSRCSLPLLKQGGVFLQICALFQETHQNSVHDCYTQLEIFEKLLTDKTPFLKEGFDPNEDINTLQLMLSIENASGLLLEDEPFDLFEKRLGALVEKHPLAYLGLVWNQNNRFSGSIACSSNRGLSDEGKEVLRLLDKYSIPVDVSHASDRTVEDIFNFIDINNLKMIPVASHSNFRDVWNEKRNLTKEYAQEISRRGGLIGLNLYQQFVGTNFKEFFLKHIFYAKETLGSWDSICLGSDFFYSLTLNYFDNEFGSSACFPLLAKLLAEHLSEEELHQLFHTNIQNFLCQKVLLEKY